MEIERQSADDLGNAVLLWRQNRLTEAIAITQELLAKKPDEAQLRDFHAAILLQVGQAENAAGIYAGLVAGEGRNDARLWVRYGNALRTAGDAAGCVDAYRRAAAVQPDLGEAYCSLANLKTYRFAGPEIAHMQAQVMRAGLSPESRVAFHFALGKALGDSGDYVRSFAQYAAGNALWRARLTHDAAATSALIDRCIQVFTADLLRRGEAGHDSAAPIFVVGLPRAGSTLVEQILAAHSLVEGAGELPEIMSVAAEIDRTAPQRYPDALRSFTAEQFRQLAERYLERSRIYRSLNRRHFVDKMPNNFAHVGLIHLLLPNAKIVDVRRGAMACCFSNFSHHFARGQQFAYELKELARYYADYARLMAHWNAVLPGKVHRVRYEDLIQNPEGEIRALLEFLGLPFEPDCLRFFEGVRAVRTASSEQVRQPLFRSGLEFWRNYEPWLGPLREALGHLAET